MSRYQPPFSITPSVLNLVVEIGELLGHWSAKRGEASPLLRKKTAFVLFRRHSRLNIIA